MAAPQLQTFRVEIAIIQGRNLASKDTNGLSDPFCVGLIGPQEQIYKTKIVPKSLNPKWNESFTLGRYRPGVDEPIVIECWDHDILDVPEFMGRCELPITSSADNKIGIWIPLKSRGVSNERVTGDLQFNIRVSCVNVLMEDWLWQKSKKTCITKQRYFVLFEKASCTQPKGNSKDKVIWLCSYKDSTCYEERHCFDLISRPLEARFSEQRIFISFVQTNSQQPQHEELVLRGTKQSVANWTKFLTPYCAKILPPDERPTAKKSNSSKTEANNSSSTSQAKPQEQRKCKYFGISLEELAKMGCFGTNRKEAPKFLKALIKEIETRGSSEIGIFRISGDKTGVDDLLQRINNDQENFLKPTDQIHDISSALKLFIRSLPEPLLTFNLYGNFITAIKINDVTASFEAIKKLVNQLPELHKIVISEVLDLLHELSKHPDITKMSVANLSIVFGPTFLWENNQDALTMLENVKPVNGVAEMLIVQYPLLFTETVTAIPIKPTIQPNQQQHFFGNARRRGEYQTRTTTVSAVADRDIRNSEKRAMELFHAYDKDHNGFVDLDEFLCFFIDLIQVANLNYFRSEDIHELMQSLSEGEMKLTPAQFSQWWKAFHASLNTDE